MQAVYIMQDASPRRQPQSKAAFTFQMLQGLNAICMLAQLVIDFRYDNIISATIIFFSTGLLLIYIQATDACKTRLISSFMLLGFCVTTQFGASLGQTMTWSPVAAGLRIPTQTFGHLAGLQLIAIMAHLAFRHFNAINGVADSIANRVLTPMGIFITPSPGNLWLLGIIGFVAQTVGASATGNVLGKAVDGLRFLAWSPFLIPIYHARFGETYCDRKKQFLAIALYFGMAMALGMALNFRGLMLFGATTAALVFLLMLLQDESPVKPGIFLKLIAASAAISVLVIALGYLAKAMLIARGQRGQATPIEMLTLTVETLFDKNRINAMTAEANLDPILGLYDEQYLTSPILSRFIETKFHDNALFYGALLTDNNVENLLITTRDQFVTVLPDPLLKFLEIKIKKDDVFFSMGDYMSNLAYGLPIGGFKTGSALAQGISLFGFLFYPIYLIIVITLMILNESQRRVESTGLMNISPTIMLAALPIFSRGLTSESFATILNVFRVIPQNLIIFAIMYWVSRRFFKPYMPR